MTHPCGPTQPLRQCTEALPDRAYQLYVEFLSHADNMWVLRLLCLPRLLHLLRCSTGACTIGRKAARRGEARPHRRSHTSRALAD